MSTVFRNLSTGDLAEPDDPSEVARLAAMPERWEKVTGDPTDLTPLVSFGVLASDRQVAGKDAGDRAGDPDPEPLPGPVPNESHPDVVGQRDVAQPDGELPAALNATPGVAVPADAAPAEPAAAADDDEPAKPARSSKVTSRR